MRRRLLVLLLVAVALASVSVVGRAEPKSNCAHGASSVGPVTIVDGRVVGSTVSHPTGCTP